MCYSTHICECVIVHIYVILFTGEDQSVKLIYPKQLVMYGTLTGHHGYISTLCFHPHKPNILFSKCRNHFTVK